MKILVVGGGGRENALVWKLVQHHDPVFCAPGNAGIERLAECVEIEASDITGLADFAERGRIDLTVVGPEAPLVAGIADEFQSRSLPIFGPTAAGARLEGDKSYAKMMMKKLDIPTADFETFDDYDRARDYLATKALPIVIKASGLAAGKGALILDSPDKAQQVLKDMMVEGTFGEAGRTVVIEEFLRGEEASIIGLCDGERVELLVPSQDHKRLLDGDQGPNTGGMGAYAPAPSVTPAIADEIEQKVFDPLLAGLKETGTSYRGVIYAGIMLTDNGVKVLEFNSRFGDPETQAILPLMLGDLGELLLACAEGKLGDRKAQWLDRAALCVVAASGGYPGSYEKGYPILGQLTGKGNMVVFHAGTRMEEGQLVTNGGRVLGVTGVGADIRQAHERAYEAIGAIEFEGMQYRQDIGYRGLERLRL